MNTLKIIGLRIEKYIDQIVSGHNCDFTYTDSEFERHVLCALKEDNSKIEITLSYSEGECGSGWCTASYGHISVIHVDKFNGYTHIPLTNLTIPEFKESDEYINNDVFSLDRWGGDDYYPSGSYTINMSLFKETQRHQSLRPVWLFKGNSGLGKSFLSGKLKDLKVYETDMNHQLPSNNTADIIVLGNKHQFSVQNIKNSLFGEFNLIIVDFTK